MTWLMLLFLLIVAHAAFDYALQGDTVAVNKNPNAATPLQQHVPWYYWMASHALMHGGAVAFLTHNVWLGLAETVAHFVIDYGKCLHKYTIHGDQLLHLACKITWLLIWVFVQ
jgi:hypothetical protein